MKIFWPWRKKKPFSLLEGLTYTPPAPNLSANQPCSTKEERGPHPLNAPGPFYVENHECITCGYPHMLAPDLMEWEREAEGRELHCYFKKQPETEYEMEQAIKAIQGSCCGALQYKGDDRKIRKRLS